VSLKISNKRLVEMMKSGLLIICSYDHLKHYNFLGSMDANIGRNCRKMPSQSLDFLASMGLWSVKEVGAKLYKLIGAKSSLIKWSQDWSLDP
jgi:hypothetical protein